MKCPICNKLCKHINDYFYNCLSCYSLHIKKDGSKYIEYFIFKRHQIIVNYPPDSFTHIDIFGFTSIRLDGVILSFNKLKDLEYIKKISCLI